MVTRLNFTKKQLLELKNLSSSRIYVYDEKVNELVVTVTSKGSKSFFVYRKINGIPKRITIGKFPDLSIEQARKAAIDLISKIAEGIDPVAEKKANKVSQITLQQAFDEYLDKHENLKPATIQDYKASMEITFKDWLEKPLLNITECMILERYKKRGVKSKSRASNSMRVLSTVFNFAIYRYKYSNGESIIPNNPVCNASN